MFSMPAKLGPQHLEECGHMVGTSRAFSGWMDSCLHKGVGDCWWGDTLSGRCVVSYTK